MDGRLCWLPMLRVLTQEGGTGMAAGVQDVTAPTPQAELWGLHHPVACALPGSWALGQPCTALEAYSAPHGI